MRFIQVLVPPFKLTFRNHFRGTEVQCSSVEYVIDRTGLPPSVMFTHDGHHDYIHLPINMRTPLSSSTVRPYPFAVSELTAAAAMPMDLAVETPVPCKPITHPPVVMATTTLNKNGDLCHEVISGHNE